MGLRAKAPQRLSKGTRGTMEYIHALRQNQTKAAIVFLHGFGGNTTRTWGDFPSLVATSSALDKWDICALGYNTSLVPDIFGLWRADASIEMYSTYLCTCLLDGALSKYSALTLVGHSMGGLIIQHALVNNERVRSKVSHVFLFATPSAGISREYSLLTRFKRPVEDMMQGSTFITNLRAGWAHHFTSTTPFELRVVAGDRDALVPPESVLTPFPDMVHAVSAGDHIQVVKPKVFEDPSVQLVTNTLAGNGIGAGHLNSAAVALELLAYRRVIDQLEPNKDNLDEGSALYYALALESIGQSQDAISYLKSRKLNSTDAYGVLAGRLKRRWLVARSDLDAQRALELYSNAYQRSVGNADHEQASYHQINIAFLQTVYGQNHCSAKEHARSVLKHCADSKQTLWCRASQAEAHLILGNYDISTAFYKLAVEMNPEPRQVRSMFQQAAYLADSLKEWTFLQELTDIVAGVDA